MINNKIASVYSDFTTNENFALLFEESLKQEKQEGSVVTGTIIGIDNDVVVVDLGAKAEGRVSIKEFTRPDGTIDAEVGKRVEVFLETLENSKGVPVISREKAIRQESWRKLEETCKDGDTIEGTIFGRVKGGFTVDIGGVVAFLPGSQVDIRPIKDITPLMNISQPFQILKMDTKQGNIVVSRRAILEEARQGERAEMLSKIEEGVSLKGIVKNITDYGAFVDLGSVDGLLHVTDISWSRISHPSEVLSVGQEIMVKVIKFNDDTKRISLGMKQLEGNPWDGIETRFPKNTKFIGKVTNITDYGAFVEIADGIEGLVHVSEISWIKNNTHPSKRLNVGQEVEVMVLDINSDKHRISLGMKQCEQNPWQEFANKYSVNDSVEGEIKNTVDFGVFVGFNNGVDGLVHVSDLCWSDSPDKKLKELSIGQKINVKILSIDVEKERISLGVKQLGEDPNKARFDGLKKNSTVTCIVSQVKEDGIEVKINDDVKSFIKKGDLAQDRVDQRPDRFAVGDKVDAKVISIEKNRGLVSLSIKALEVAEQKKAIEEYGSADSGASLGDILGAALNSSNDAKKARRNNEES